jgi:hypothetical protein
MYQECQPIAIPPFPAPVSGSRTGSRCVYVPRTPCLMVLEKTVLLAHPKVLIKKNLFFRDPVGAGASSFSYSC